MSAIEGYVTFVKLMRVGLFYVGAGVAVDLRVRLGRAHATHQSVQPIRALLSRSCRSRVAADRARDRARRRLAVVGRVVGARRVRRVAAIALISLLDFLGDILYQVIAVSQQPGQAPMLLVSWAFAILRLALLVRVLSSWLPISPYSKWIRWSYVLTDWMIIPLRRLIPRIGMIDITPIVAWFLLSLLQRMLGIP